MIATGKHYTTRDGRTVRIYATDAGGNYPVHGAVWYAGLKEWMPVSWMVDGRRFVNESGVDLVKPRIKRTIWVAMYEGYCTHFLSRPTRLDSDCLACPEVDIDCEHGEGLSND